MRHVVIAIALALAASGPVRVGEVAPDFELRDQNGAVVRLSSAVEAGPVVLVFYRGYW
jgi:peroxiredoxin